jgi:predicted dehydrogenase
MVRVAILGFWHVHAEDYAREAEAHPEAEVVAVWDEDPGRGRAAAAARGVRFVERLEEVLADPGVDGVVVTTATVAHRAVIPAAAEAGKHVFTEKVIAPTRREAAEIVAAVERAGVAFVVSLPRLAAGYARAIKSMLDGGELGGIPFVRVRVGHDGALPSAEHPEGWLPGRFFDPAEAAGGALIDLGAHPLYLLRWFLGLPERVSASYGRVTGRAVEDNAVVTLAYASGALGVAEVGFVGRSPLTIEVHGTTGSLLFGLPDDRLLVRDPATAPRAGGWVAREDLPADGPSPFAQWIAHIQDGTRATENVALALDLSALAEAANRSAAEGRAVGLDDVVT